MNLGIIRGYVEIDGTIESGSGFTVNHTQGTGIYYINFEMEFLDIPAVTVAEVYNGDIE